MGFESRLYISTSTTIQLSLFSSKCLQHPKNRPINAEKINAIFLQALKNTSLHSTESVNETILRLAGIFNKAAVPLFANKDHVLAIPEKKAPLQARTVDELHLIPASNRVFIGIKTDDESIQISEHFKKMRQAPKDAPVENPTASTAAAPPVTLVIKGQTVTLNVTGTLSEDLDYMVLALAANLFIRTVAKKEDKPHSEELDQVIHREGTGQTQKRTQEKSRGTNQQETQQTSGSQKADAYEETLADEARQAKKKRNQRLAEATRQDHVRVDIKHLKEELAQAALNAQAK